MTPGHKWQFFLEASRKSTTDPRSAGAGASRRGSYGRSASAPRTAFTAASARGRTGQVIDRGWLSPVRSKSLARPTSEKLSDE